MLTHDVTLALSHRATGHMRESEALRTLEGEKELLITEKHRLKDDVNAVRKQLSEETRKWSGERDELRNIIAEKTKLIEDNSTIAEKMQKEIVKLKEQVRYAIIASSAVTVHNDTFADN